MNSRLRKSREFDLITSLFSKSRAPSFDLGIGDDAAVFSPPSNQSLVLSIDTSVEGRHFPAGFPPEFIAKRALGSALSDLAAMGAQPHHFTMALTLPEFDMVWCERFSTGLYDLAEQFDISLVGGDTTKGPLTISIQVHGLVDKGNYLSRSSASPDDLIFVSGCLGDAHAGLLLALEGKELTEPYQQALFESFASPTPQIALGLEVNGIASSALDISDGLLADLEHLCCASGLSAELELSVVPLSDNLLRYRDYDFALQAALNGGDDYQLLVTASSDKRQRLLELGFIEIGAMLADEGSVLSAKLNGESVALPEKRGFDHFE